MYRPSHCSLVPYACADCVFIASIAREWDANVAERIRELEGGMDASYAALVGHFQNFIGSQLDKQKVADIGCGLGHMTHALSERATKVVGIDISSQSIRYAQRTFPSIKFHNWCISEAAYRLEGQFTTCIANMVLHNTPSLHKSLADVRKLLGPKGVFALTVPHPTKWFSKRSYVSTCRVGYSTDLTFKLPFRIRNGRTHPALITYFHRSVSEYERSLTHAGFSILELSESLPGLPDILFVAAISK